MRTKNTAKITEPKELIDRVLEWGFLPFFQNEIEGFSLEECCPSELWFAEDVDGPWEWKGPVARSGKCVYGKFFNGKAGFISLEWLPDFANYRRNGYDFDARYEDGLASYKDKGIYDTLVSKESILSNELKKLCNYQKGGNKGFDTVVTRLQMQTYVCIGNFEYMLDKQGNPYGWGVARYTTPEALFGYELVTSAYKKDPIHSRERILSALQKLLPSEKEEKLQKLIK